MPMPTPFNNLITFSRGSNATVTGSNGLIQWAPNNVVTNSESFDAAAWVKAAATVSANVTASPEGTTTADKIVETATTAPHAVYQVFTYGAGLVYAATVYAKKAERNWIYVGADTAAAEAVFFDLDNGTVGSQGTGYVGSITDAGNGWYRCTVIITQSTALPPNFLVVGLASANGTFSYAGNGTSGAFIWGAQLELGSTATTYNPTTVKNLLGFSEAFDNAGWTKGGASIVTGAQANPVNGLFNAQKLMENTAAATNHYAAQILTTLNAGKPITLSVYAKAGERRYIALLEGFSNKGQYFDLQTGTVGGVLIGAPTSASIAAVGNGWYRCTITISVVSATASLEVYLSNTGSTISYTGDGNSGVYIYGAQLSDSASLDPYVPTPGAAPSSTAFYGPRFDYDPVTLQPRGLLVEEQRTNFQWSQDLDNAFWTKSGASVAVNTTTAPDGTTTADKLVENTATSTHFAARFPTIAAATSYSFSVYIKAAGRTFTRVLVGDTAGANGVYVDANLATGATATGTNGTGWTLISASATAVGNGWFRIIVSGTNATATTGGIALIYPSSASGVINYLGDGVSGLFVWGAQFETGAFATSYIPTVASTVTRSADVATMTGTNFSSWYNQSEGSFAVEVSYLNASTISLAATAYSGDPGTTNSYISYVKTSGAINRQSIVTAGVGQGNLEFSGVVAGQIYKMAGAYKVNDVAFSVNGAAALTDATVTLPTPDGLAIGFLFTNYLNGHIRNIRFIPARAADFQLQGLST